MDKALQIKREISIPMYFKDFVNSTIDLKRTPKICCPFHKEDTPSFSYNAERNVWRCFGACKAGGDVIEMHRHHMHLHSRQEAIDSLISLYKLTVAKGIQKVEYEIDTALVEYNKSYIEALALARNIEDWLELDYIMGQNLRINERGELLKDFIQIRR